MALNSSVIWVFLLALVALFVGNAINSWRKKKFKGFITRTLIITLSLVLIIVGYFTLPWVALYVGLQLSSAPPRPEVTYGEFPFRLEYEMNGKRIVLKDTVICEYAGIGIDEGNGKHREWKEHLASGKERLTLLKLNDTQEIFYRTGYADYFMGDQGEGVSYAFSFPNANFLDTAKEKKGIYYESTITADELLRKYNIKLINWEYAKPITQKFEK